MVVLEVTKTVEGIELEGGMKRGLLREENSYRNLERHK